jgi:hypothetical protein
MSKINPLKANRFGWAKARLVFTATPSAKADGSTQDSWYTPVKNGFVARSRPIVVSGP